VNLLAALRRTDHALRCALGRTPIRDADEILEHNRILLESFREQLLIHPDLGYRPGDLVVLRKGFCYSASKEFIPGYHPVGGELAMVEHVYKPEHYGNGETSQSLWIQFENGFEICTWTKYVALYLSDDKTIANFREKQTPTLPLFLLGGRRIQVLEQ
jgi:hypothetical protein